MSNKDLIFIDAVHEIPLFTNDQLASSKIFSFDIYVHKKLEQQGILHEIAENYLDSKDRTMIFDTTVSYWNWYDDEIITKDFLIEGINLLGMLDVNEIHDYLLNRLLIFLMLKRIIEKEKPVKIISSARFITILKPLIENKNIALETINMEAKYFIPFEKFPIRINVGPFSFTVQVQKSSYFKFKNIFEKIVGSVFHLWYNVKDKKNVILFLEFDPSSYEDLFYNLAKSNKTPLILNRRRSAIWNFKSIKTLTKFNCKLLNENSLLTQEDNRKICAMTDFYKSKMENLWLNNEFFSKLFSIEEISFWDAIKDDLINTFRNRLDEFVKLVFVSKRVIETIHPVCIVSLYTLGETEKAIYDINENKIPSILLEHGYANYVKETSRFDVSSMYTTFRDKIALWGDLQKQYLVKYRNVDEKRILVVGSPRHDIFFKKNIHRISNDKKTLLIIISPIDTYTSLNDTNTYLAFERVAKFVTTTLEKFSNVEIIVKLHPGRDLSNNFFKQVFQQINSKIKIFQTTPIIKHLEQCDAALHIDATGIGPSTAVLESFIMNKPVLNIVLKDIIYEFECIKDNALPTFSYRDNYSKILIDILFDDDVRNKLVMNGRNHVNRYLTNPGEASRHFAKILNSY